MKVYLAGPITGYTFNQGQEWRKLVSDEFSSHNIQAFSPLRGKEYLRAEGPLHAGTYDNNPLSTGLGIVTRDRYDVQSCDAILMNLIPATDKISIGTMVELGWADAYRKPVVVAIPGPGSIHDHAFVRQLGIVVYDLWQAVDIIKHILLPRNDGTRR